MTQDHWNIPSEERQRQLGTDVSDVNTLRGAMALVTNPSSTTCHSEAIRAGLRGRIDFEIWCAPKKKSAAKCRALRPIWRSLCYQGTILRRPFFFLLLDSFWLLESVAFWPEFGVPSAFCAAVE